ncbi:MAG: hypothetical protein ACYC7L_12970, partial [Nitrospirota bacterium]
VRLTKISGPHVFRPNSCKSHGSMTGMRLRRSGTMLLTDDDLPVVADAVLDYVGEVWAAQDKKGFRTFLAFLTYHLHRREHGLTDHVIRS